MDLQKYNIWKPCFGNGIQPPKPPGWKTPKHAMPAAFDPTKVTLHGNYLGSRKLRASQDPKDQRVIALLDQDAVSMARKNWNREVEYVQTGLIVLGPVGESLLSLLL